jgi:hypothetical protein
MNRLLLGCMGALFAATAMVVVASQPVSAQSVKATGSVNAQWRVLPTVNVVLTPNYYTGYGSVQAVFGTQPAPTHGPGATGVGAGTVDFGTAIAGTTYLYKYAAHLAVTTNDGSGFVVYGEAATQLLNNSDGSAYSINSALYYLNSGATSDSNTGFSPALPFQQATGAVSGGGDSVGTPASIAYSGNPASSPLATSTSETGNYYYDYEFKVPFNATNGNYYVWIVYTVIGQ